MLEKGNGSAPTVAHLLRLAHTLKGAARVVKQRDIADLSHAVEDALLPFKDAPTQARSIDALLGLLDGISKRLDALNQPPPPVPATRPAHHENAVNTVHADVSEMDSLLEGVSEVGVQLSIAKRSEAALDKARQLLGQLASQPDVAGVPMTAELTESIRQLLASTRRELASSLEQTGRELQQVRESVERLRLVPASTMFNTLERTARDAAVSLGKTVRFEARGGEVTLDGNMVSAVQSALMQAVRNSIAHGIAQTGSVALSVVRRGNTVSFICQDDGRGVDLEAVRHALLQRGVAALGLNEPELLKCLMESSISTAQQVTGVAGRGIGLDVVREVANRLRGTASLSNATGHGGAVLNLTVPVSLSSLDALVVGAGTQRLAIPLEAVRSTLKVEAVNVARANDRETVRVGVEVLPFFHMARAFGDGRPSGRGGPAVVIQAHSGARVVIGVDELFGTHNLVLRPLPPLTGIDLAVVGASLDADGNPQLMLDPEGLCALAAHASTSAGATTTVTPAPILIVDDSLTTRMLEQSILESAGYVVEQATNAEEGLAMARSRPYALFLVDVEMPGMDGFNFITHLRADSALRTVPAILVTSCNTPEYRARGEAVGAQAYIVKSEFNQSELLSRIRTLVGPR